MLTLISSITELLSNLRNLSLSLCIEYTCVGSSLGQLAVELCCDLVVGRHASRNMIVNMACEYRKCSSSSSSSSKGQSCNAAMR
jgi:hypothetical protein